MMKLHQIDAKNQILNAVSQSRYRNKSKRMQNEDQEHTTAIIIDEGKEVGEAKRFRKLNLKKQDTSSYCTRALMTIYRR